MSKVVSVINLKGGVGKTTTTVVLAEFLSFEYKKKVLVIDLDPQTNATVMLINQNQWKKANDNKKTIYHLFIDQLQNTHNFNLQNSIIRSVSNVGGGISRLHLLPSSIDLLDIQEKLTHMSYTGIFPQNPIMLLASRLNEEVLNEYDYILIDCPPNLGTITLNGLYISDYYLIPVIPDILSTYGVPQIIDRVNKYSKEIRTVNKGYNIKPLGIIVTKFRSASSMHKRIKQDLTEKGDSGSLPKVFPYSIKETNSVSEATDISASVSNLKQKYGYQKDLYECFNNLTKEFIKRTI